MVLGSGLGPIADAVQGATVIPYGDIPHFHAPGVQGHPGRLVIGHFNGVPALVLQVGLSLCLVAGQNLQLLVEVCYVECQILVLQVGFGAAAGCSCGQGEHAVSRSGGIGCCMCWSHGLVVLRLRLGRAFSCWMECIRSKHLPEQCWVSRRNRQG
jgi:hypothetical protein